MGRSVVLLLALLLVPAPVAGALLAEPVLWVPERVGPAASVPFTVDAGPVTRGTVVDILVDGRVAWRGWASLVGPTSGSFPAPTTPGEHSVVALVRIVGYAGTPLDERSAPRPLVVAGPPRTPLLSWSVDVPSPTVRLAWTPDPTGDPLVPIVGYRIDVATATGGWQARETLPATARSANLTFTDAVGRVALVALSHGQESPRAVAELGLEAPGAPGDVTVTKAARITVAWSPPATGGPTQGYHVLVNGAVVARPAGNATSWTLDISTAGTYLVAVRAYNVASRGVLTEVPPVVLRVPTAPEALAIQGATGMVVCVPEDPCPTEPDSSARLTWSPPNDTDGAPLQQYRIYRASATGGFALVGTASWGTFIDDHVARAQTYRYRVTAVTARGEGNAAEGSVKIPNATDELVGKVAGFRVCYERPPGFVRCDEVPNPGQLDTGGPSTAFASARIKGRVVENGAVPASVEVVLSIDLCEMGFCDSYEETHVVTPAANGTFAVTSNEYDEVTRDGAPQSIEMRVRATIRTKTLFTTATGVLRVTD